MYETLPFLREFLQNYTLKDKDTLDELEIQIKYEGYIIKEQTIADKMLKHENLTIPSTIDYLEMKSLSYEAREKLSQIKPSTIGQASRISGVTPADISVLLIYLNR